MARMKIACLQFNPVRYATERNINKANSILRGQRKGSFDLLVLPEMAFTGYNYSSKEDIGPYLEEAGKGPTFRWASEIAQSIDAQVLVGYPESAQDGPFNAAVFVNRSGRMAANYRKNFLYDQDYLWAQTGVGFQIYNELEGLPSTAIGICMDLNPEKFLAPFEAFEFANFALERNATLILAPMAWLSGDHHGAVHAEGTTPSGSPQLRTINYWATRLLPLVGKPNKVTFVAANRCGKEDDTTFAGSSSILQFFPPESNGSKRGKVQLVDCLGWDQEGLLVHEVDV